jgi:hypothetical protein
MEFGFSQLVAGFVFGVLGMWFVKRAKAEGDLKFFTVGMLLIVYPYFVENPWSLWATGIALVVYGAKA